MKSIIISIVSIFLFTAIISTPLPVLAKKVKITSSTKKIEKKKLKPNSKKKKSINKKKNLKNKKKDKSPKKKKLTEAEKKLKSEKQKVKYINETLDYGILKERLDALNRINLIKNKKLLKQLAKKLEKMLTTEFDAEIKMKTIYMLGELKDKNAIENIAKLIDDDSEDVRIAAVYALKTLEAKSKKDILIKKLKKQDLSKDSNFTQSLIETLGEFKATELIDFAEKSIKSNKTSKLNRQTFVLFLGKQGDKKAGKFLTELYSDPDENKLIRAYSINSIAHIKYKKAIPEIKKLLKEIDNYKFKKRKKYFNLAMYSVSALVKLGDKSALPRLINSLRSNNTRLRVRAIRLLKELKEKSSIDILKYKMKYDPSEKVQKEAKLALKEMGVKIDEEKDKKNKKEKSKKKKEKK